MLSRSPLPAPRADPNVYPSGKVCLVRAARPRRVRTRLRLAQSILNDEKGWKPSVTVKQILTGIQELLDAPNNNDAAQEPAWRLMKQSIPKYIERVKLEVSKYPAEGGGAGDDRNGVVVL